MLYCNVLNGVYALFEVWLPFPPPPCNVLICSCVVLFLCLEFPLRGAFFCGEGVEKEWLILPQRLAFSGSHQGKHNFGCPGPSGCSNTPSTPTPTPPHPTSSCLRLVEYPSAKKLNNWVVFPCFCKGIFKRVYGFFRQLIPIIINSVRQGSWCTVEVALGLYIFHLWPPVRLLFSSKKNLTVNVDCSVAILDTWRILTRFQRHFKDCEILIFHDKF